jgi:hypothetical protein
LARFPEYIPNIPAKKTLTETEIIIIFTGAPLVRKPIKMA